MREGDREFGRLESLLPSDLPLRRGPGRRPKGRHRRRASLGSVLVSECQSTSFFSNFRSCGLLLTSFASAFKFSSPTIKGIRANDPSWYAQNRRDFEPSSNARSWIVGS